MEIVNGIKFYTCPICHKPFPEISNSAPYKDGAPCISCFMSKQKKKPFKRDKRYKTRRR